jgi:hypothetical protein
VSLMKSASAVCITSRFRQPLRAGNREGGNSTRNRAVRGRCAPRA